MTTNIDLQRIADKLKLSNFRGIYMKNELKNMTPQENECGIVNFENETQDGSHWVSWVKRGTEKYFFCSFGAPILPEIKDYLGSPINCHNFQVQSMGSSICGELCIFFIYLMSKGIPYEDVVLSMI